MSQILQCPSCGGSNQLPEGRNSMFCAFCGTVVQAQIQQPFSSAINSSLLSKPNITVKSFKGNTPWFQSSGERRVDGGIEYWDKIRDKWVFIEDEEERTLTLTDRNISSIEEITSWFSDNELEEIDILNISNNNITSLKGIERFKGLKELDLSRNRISSLSGLHKLCVCSLKLNLSDNCFEILDDMVRFNLESTSSSSNELTINLSNNLVLKDISDDVVNSLNSNSNYFYNLSFNFEGCEAFDIQLINKINFRNILIKENATDDDTINVFVDITSPLCTLYEPHFIANNNSAESDSNDYISNNNTRDKSNKPNVIQNIFGRLNILDWIALFTPYIIAIVLYQQIFKNDKTSDIGFLENLVFCLGIAIAIRFYPFFSRKEKTGRSFESKYGTLHEYTTVEGKVNTEHGWWIVSLIHIIVIALIIYFHGFGSSNSASQSSSTETTSSQNQDNSTNNNSSNQISDLGNKIEQQSDGTLKIGNQEWMSQNLNIESFRNGDPIPQAQSNEEWENMGKNGQPAWCYYNNDPVNSQYGKLYNWYAVNDSRGLAPEGYHVPTNEEVWDLFKSLGCDQWADVQMKADLASVLFNKFQLPNNLGGRYESGSFLDNPSKDICLLWTNYGYKNNDEEYNSSDWGVWNGFADGPGSPTYKGGCGFFVRCLKGEGITENNSNPNGNSQVEQLPIDNSNIETNSNQNGVKQLLLNYYQSIENNSFDANNYFDEKAAFYWEENLTPSKINKFYDLHVLGKIGSWQSSSNFKVNIVNNQIDLKSMQKDVCLYTYTINESRYDNQNKYTILDKVLIEVGYNVYKQKLVSYKTLKVIETKFQINGKIYSSPTKYITAKVISVDELKDNYFSLTFDLMAEKISFNFPPNEMPVVGDKYSIQVGVDESVPYKSHSGLRALQPYHKRQ